MASKGTDKGKKAWGKDETKTNPPSISSSSSSSSVSSISSGQSAGAANHPAANVAKSKKSTQGFALVKAVLSGDSVVLMGALPPGATQLPPERVIALSGIQAPRCARTKNQGNDEPYAYESREFLRKKVIGQTVQFDVAAISEGGREYGKVLSNGENLAHMVVRAGWATVKQPANQKEGARVPPEREELLGLQEAAKAEGLGVHSRVSKPEDHIRKIDWNPDPRAFFNENKNNRLPAIIDGVRDGSTIRAEIIGSGLHNTMITVLLAGAQAPRVPLPYSLMIQQYEKKRQEDPTFNGPRPLPEDAKPEAFGIDAQHFTESRLMHRDVHIILHGCDKFGNLFGTVDFPKGNITLKLLELGYSKLVPWSANLTPIAAQLKTAEENAKKNKLRIWTKYVEGQSSTTMSDHDGNPLEESEPLPAEWQGKVVQIVQADTIIIEDAKGINRRVYLASIRCPKSGNPRTGQGEEAGAFEAREHVRGKLIGRKVKVLAEYTRPPPPESIDQSIRQYVSILHNKLNIAESLLLAGLGTVMRHRIDESRSQFYDAYIAAEEKAIQSKVGIHVKGLLKPNRVIDLSERFVKKVSKKDDEEEDESEKKGKETASNKQKALSVKARQYLPLLQRDRSLNAVVEHVFSSTRVKLYLPSQHIAIAFVLAGVRGPARKTDGSFDAYNDDAIAFAKSKLLQHDVRVEIDTMDKGDNFIGNLFIEHKNFATALLSEGLATIYSYSADRSPYRNELIEAERNAREEKKGLWKDYVPPTPEELAKKAMEEKGDSAEDIGGQSRPIRITEIHDANNFFIQFADVNVVDTISSKLNALYDSGADSEPFTPNAKGGQLCAGQWGEENEWYRVRVEGQAGDGEYRVVFIDYGNSDVIDQAHLRQLPEDIAKIPAQALHATLAGVAAPANPDYFDDAVEAFGEMVWEVDLHARIEFVDRDRKYHITLFDPTSAESESLTVNRALIRDGWARVAKRIDRRIQHLVDDLKAEEQEAVHHHAGIFEYGDVSDDEHEDDFLPRGKR